MISAYQQLVGAAMLRPSRRCACHALALCVDTVWPRAQYQSSTRGVRNCVVGAMRLHLAVYVHAHVRTRRIGRFLRTSCRSHLRIAVLTLYAQAKQCHYAR